MPKVLFDGDLSLEATTLYSLMLDRVGLSAKNGWTDSLGRVFIYFVQKDVQKLLRCGHNRATAFMRELEPSRNEEKVSANKALFSAPMEAVKTAQAGQSRVPAGGSLDCPDQAPNETEKKEKEFTETYHILPQPPRFSGSRPRYSWNLMNEM